MDVLSTWWNGRVLLLIAFDVSVDLITCRNACQYRNDFE